MLPTPVTRLPSPTLCLPVPAPRAALRALPPGPHPGKRPCPHSSSGHRQSGVPLPLGPPPPGSFLLCPTAPHLHVPTCVRVVCCSPPTAPGQQRWKTDGPSPERVLQPTPFLPVSLNGAGPGSHLGENLPSAASHPKDRGHESPHHLGCVGWTAWQVALCLTYG